MQNKKQILPGTPAWEALCKQCGLCCLLKVVDEYGNICLTRVRCRHLGKNRLCDCYNIKFDDRNSDNNDSCFKSGDSPVNIETLHHDYVVPGCCPYVQEFVGPNNLKAPTVDWENTISETELPANPDLKQYKIYGSGVLFRYHGKQK